MTRWRFLSYPGLKVLTAFCSVPQSAEDSLSIAYTGLSVPEKNRPFTTGTNSHRSNLRKVQGQMLVPEPAHTLECFNCSIRVAHWTTAGASSTRQNVHECGSSNGGAWPADTKRPGENKKKIAQRNLPQKRQQLTLLKFSDERVVISAWVYLDYFSGTDPEHVAPEKVVKVFLGKKRNIVRELFNNRASLYALHPPNSQCFSSYNQSAEGSLLLATVLPTQSQVKTSILFIGLQMLQLLHRPCVSPDLKLPSYLPDTLEGEISNPFYIQPQKCC
ncbi:unnamed protein product [Protopolystoma xenopodis]|uniref:Uncharacterized protein n=1 Tax=Protopolystoma xenopodis TaxID=117903 RepID=A0A448XBD1_9PLAT|nr:unnamed protein product [Protopolystoma xenopodis]